MAILVLDRPIDATGYPGFVDVYNVETSGSELGKEMTIIGYGKYGPIEGGDPDVGNVFHRGMNVWDKIEYNTLQYTMNKQDDGGLYLEAIGWAGDSGGPAFIEVDGKLQISGTSSAGRCCDYGDTDAYCRLGDFAWQWIQDNINIGE